MHAVRSSTTHLTRSAPATRMLATAAVAAMLAVSGPASRLAQADATPTAEHRGAKDATAIAVVDGLSIEVAATSTEGVWQVTVRPASDGQPADAKTNIKTSGGVASINPKTGRIDIRDEGGRIAWEGGISPIESFGRAKVPGLEISWKAPAGERLYGLGERFNALDQAGKKVDCWIEDAPGQGDTSAHTYFVTPVAYSSAGYAFFASTNPEATFDLNTAGDGTNRYLRPDREVTFFVAVAPTLVDLIAKRAAVQGLPRAIPDWAYGAWISRNSYETQAEAEEAIQGHLQRGYPVAAIVQEAWKGSSETGDFNNFSKERWPRLDEFFSLCKQHGIHNVLWQVPIIHPSSPQFAEGKSKGYFVKKPDGSISFRKEWLAGFANLDFTNPEAVKWWKDQMRDEVRMGVFGYKADDGEDIKADDVFHDGRRGWQMHNEFSTLYNKALIELFDEEHVPGMLWARSGSLGNHLYPGLWAGDQEATWQQMRSLIPAGLSTGISGMPYWSHDIGGYFGESKPELYTRWLQLGALSPMMQYHGNKPREPWYFGQTADDAYKLLVHLRMNLKPTFVALGNEAARTGLPIMRPVALHHPDDKRFFGEDTQYLLGRDLLVAPVLEQGAAGRVVKFPAGTWHHALQPLSFQGPGEFEVPIGLVDAPLFVRDGAVTNVQLAEGKSLGEWRPDAPIRDLKWTAARAVIRDLRAPLIGDPIGRTTVIAFDVAEGYRGTLAAEWYWADAPADVRQATIKASGREVTVDLTPGADDRVLGHRQVYTLRGPAMAVGSPALAFRGEVDWSSPIAVDVATDGSPIADAGPRKITTILRNRSGRPIEARVEPRAKEGIRVSPLSRAVSIPPRGEARVEWNATLPPARDEVGDLRVDFSVVAGKDVPLATASAAFALPGRWAIVGPFPAGTRQAHTTRFAPEFSLSPDVAFETGEGKTVRWQQLPTGHFARNGGIDFAEAVGHRDQAAAYAMTRLRSDREQPVELRFGSDDTLKVWLNGKLVHSVETYREAKPDQEIVKATLQAGENTLLVKVGQDVNGWRLMYRATGPDGAPLSGVGDGFNAASWAQFASDRPTSTEIVRPPASLAWRVLGPVAAMPAQAGDWTLPSDGGALKSAAEESAGWKAVPAAKSPSNRIDLAALLGPAGGSVAYVAADVTVEQPTAAAIVGGSDDGISIWLNGKLVHRAEAPRGFAPDSDHVPVTLAAGRNVIVARVNQVGGDWLVQIEPQDAQGRPLATTKRN